MPRSVEQQHRRDARAGVAEARIVVATRGARHVVVAEHDVGPAAGGNGALEALDLAAEGGRVPRRAQEREVEGEVELVAVAVVARDLVGIEEIDLADHHALGVVVVDAAEAAQQRVDVGMVLVVLVALAAVAASRPR